MCAAQQERSSVGHDRPGRCRGGEAALLAVEGRIDGVRVAAWDAWASAQAEPGPLGALGAWAVDELSALLGPRVRAPHAPHAARGGRFAPARGVAGYLPGGGVSTFAR